jgi:hypothetical protein
MQIKAWGGREGWSQVSGIGFNISDSHRAPKVNYGLDSGLPVGIMAAVTVKNGRGRGQAGRLSYVLPVALKRFMKNTPSLLRTGPLQAALLIGLGLCHGLAAAATFTVTPSAVSNTYTGTITLQIGGLTNGESVVVQEFLDANTNGVIGAGDWLVQQFRLTDGVASVIGGVTNINVPGDSTPTNGAITAQMNFATIAAGAPIAGRYLYKLSSPSGRFTPVTNLFSITNLAYSQSISGNVVCSGTNVPNAVLLAFDGPPMNSNPVGGAIGNNAGGYAIPLPPGTYSLIAFKTNYVVNRSTAPTLTLESGAKLGTNLSLVPTTRSISGKVVDAADSSLGLPGFWVFPMSTNSLIAVGITDTNGNFTARATASEWEINYDSMQLLALGYARFQDSQRVSTTTGNAAGLTIPLPKGTALFYGTVKDAQNHPLVGMRLYPSDDSDQYEGEGVTDQNGNYAVAVVAGNWNIRPESSSNPGYANFVFPQTGRIPISEGQAVREDFVGVVATNRISGYLKDGGNRPISGVWVWAEATINGAEFHNGTDTDATGHYTFNVCNGTWGVGVSCGGGGDNLGDQYLCPDSQTVTIANNNGTASFTALLAPSQISGYVKDTSNNPIANVGVYAYMPTGGNGGGANTDGNGHYSFNVVNGSWNVGLSCCGNQSLSPLGYLCVGEQSTTVSNSTGVVNFSVPHAPYQITGHLRDTSDNPIANVSVNAYGNSYNACATTAGDGSYTLYVNSGDWYINLDCGALNSLGYLCPNDQSVTVSNANVVLDLSAPQALYTISGWVRNSNNQPFTNLDVQASATIGANNYWLDSYTDANGYFSIQVANGQWWVGLDCSGLGSGYVCPDEVSVVIADASVATNFTISPVLADAVEYYVMKVDCFRQLDAVSLVPDTDNGPFAARLEIIQSGLGTVPFARIDLPSGGARNFPPGGSGIELTIYETYPSQGAFDAVYPSGNYAFSMATVNNGFPYPVLTMPVAAYPTAPRVSNFTAAQAINPANPFTLQWSNPADATTNDVIWVRIADYNGSIVFCTPYPPTNHSTSLRGTAASVVVPADTLQLGSTYTGVIGFYRVTSANTTSYPGAMGVTLVAAETSFSLAAPSALPVLSQPTRISATQFGFLLSGAAGTNYTVLASTNAALPLANWSPVLTTNLPGSSAFIQDNQATTQRRYYRVKVGP